MDKYIYNEKNGLWYELQGDYYLPCLKLPEESEVHIGIWGQRHLRYLKQYHRVRYYKKLPDLAALRKEYRSLNDRKTKLYEDYRQAKKQMQEYGVVKKNVDSILYPSQSRAREQER